MDWPERYSKSDAEIISAYWEDMKNRRDSKKILGTVIQKRMAKWEGYDKDIVIDAMVIHMDGHPEKMKREAYTEGIMRHKLAAAKEEASTEKQTVTKPRGSRMRNKIYNYEGRDWDYDGIEKRAADALPDPDEQMMSDPRIAERMKKLNGGL